MFGSAYILEGIVVTELCLFAFLYSLKTYWVWAFTGKKKHFDNSKERMLELLALSNHTAIIFQCFNGWDSVNKLRCTDSFFFFYDKP